MTFAYLCVGLLTGIISGMLGIGGGTLMIPIFIFIFGMSQHAAQGTALATIVLPVFLLATLRYYYAGHINIPVAATVAVGVMIGALAGAHIAQMVPDAALKRMFGIYLIVIGIKMTFLK